MMMDKKRMVLSVKDVEICYRVVRPLFFLQVFRKGRKKKSRYFRAVKGVSFDIGQGEIVGIIGKNGSGKSTLLRAIAGIYDPDKGQIDLCGNSVGLMAIGVGFINELSGRDNIYLSGMLLGFSRSQIDKKVDEIIAFSELGDFIDETVGSYSSGMYSKLAFSITAIMEMDILLVDETLSVGDRRFKRKSQDKMLELIQRDDKTVLIVSHNTGTLKDLCQRVLWLDDGKIVMDGETQQVLNAYEQKVDQDLLEKKVDRTEVVAK